MFRQLAWLIGTVILCSTVVTGVGFFMFVKFLFTYGGVIVTIPMLTEIAIWACVLNAVLWIGIFLAFKLSMKGVDE